MLRQPVAGCHEDFITEAGPPNQMRQPAKPPALKPGSEIAVVAPASPVEEEKLRNGCKEISRLGYVPFLDQSKVLAREGYFAGAAEDRLEALVEALTRPSRGAVFCARGGYGASYLLQGMETLGSALPRILLGYSDITCLQVYLWQKFGWVTFYGPMVAAGLDAGPGAPGGYDAESFTRAVTETRAGWTVDLQGESLAPHELEGTLLGGCLTLVEATLGTPWELDTRGAILVLEDRAMKPYQVDRALMHLKHAGKFDGLHGLILGEFPDCEPPSPSASTVRDVIRRLTLPLGIPVVWRVPVGHSARPILTLPLGVRACLVTNGISRLHILEPACSEL